jgi:chromosome segregation ATPase
LAPRDLSVALITWSPTPGGRGSMSTAGKVLVVLVLLTSLAWLVLASGVAQLNTNGNTRLHELTEQIEKLQTDFKHSQDEIVAVRDQTSSIQESNDRDRTVLRARQSDLEKARSKIIEYMTRVQYQLATVKDTIEKAKTTLQHRIEEQASEQQALVQAKSEVEDLKSKNGELLSQLSTLRQNFETVYRSNIESLGKTH